MIFYITQGKKQGGDYYYSNKYKIKYILLRFLLPSLPTPKHKKDRWVSRYWTVLVKKKKENPIQNKKTAIMAMIGSLTAHQRWILMAVKGGASSLSFVGSSFIVLCYLLFKELRKFSFKLVFYLALSVTNFLSPSLLTIFCY